MKAFVLTTAAGVVSLALLISSLLKSVLGMLYVNLQKTVGFLEVGMSAICELTK
jgi:hypothetical protein